MDLEKFSKGFFGMKPAIGHIVHYQSLGSTGEEFKFRSLPRAAIVTQVHDEIPGRDGEPSVGLMVCNPTGLYFNVDVPYSQEPKPGHWSWPPLEMSS